MTSAKFPAKNTSISDALKFIGDYIEQRDLDKNKNNELMLISEELMLKIIAVSKKDTEIEIQLIRRLNDIKIRFECAGNKANLEITEEDDISGRILSEYAEKIRQYYKHGCNIVEILVWSSASQNLQTNLNVTAIGTVIGLVLHYIFFYGSNYEFVDEMLFVPVYGYINIFKLFSPIAACLILAFFTSELIMKISGNKGIMKLGRKYTITSLICIVWGALVGDVIYRNITTLLIDESYEAMYESIIGNSIIDFLRNIIPLNILEPFEQNNPLPMLVIAIIFGLTVATMYGEKGFKVKSALDTAAEFMGSELHLIYQIFPLILLFAVADVVFNFGLYAIPIFVGYNLISVVALAAVILLYIVRLRTNGINVKEFFNNYKEIIKENFKIGSNKDAYFYNKRMLRKKTSLSDSELEDGLQLGVIMNMDGNCVMITVIIISVASLKMLTVPEMIEVLILVLLLSLGTPNQPGSLLVAPVILFSLFNLSEDYFNLLIIAEAFTGKSYSFINSLGDIVSIAIFDKKKRDEKNKLSLS